MNSDVNGICNTLFPLLFSVQPYEDEHGMIDRPGRQGVLGPNSVGKTCQNEENRKIAQFTRYSAELNKIWMEIYGFFLQG